MTDWVNIRTLAAAALMLVIAEAMKGFVGEAAKDAYKALKVRIAHWVDGDVEALEKAPASAGRQSVVAEVVDGQPPEEQASVKAFAAEGLPASKSEAKKRKGGDPVGFDEGNRRPKRPWTIYWTSDSGVPIRLRALRKLAEETKNHDLERGLYIEELKAERGVYLHQLLEETKKLPLNAAQLVAHLLWIAVMGFYWVLADYGRSFVRPAAWLVWSGFFFYWGYSEVLAKLMAKAPDIEKYKQAVGMLALGNAVPFVGPLTVDAKIKEFLFCPNNAASCLPPIPPEGFQLLVIAQNLFSITCVFFIGLALRNYFRIK